MTPVSLVADAGTSAPFGPLTTPAPSATRRDYAVHRDDDGIAHELDVSWMSTIR